MEIMEIALLAGLVILVLFTGLDAIPIILFSLNPDTMRYGFDDPAAEQEQLSRSAELREWIGRLKDMGFSPLGIKAERLPLWGRSFREAALVSRPAETYASITLHPHGIPASLYLFTPLENGGMVFTRDNRYGREAESVALSVKNVPSKDFREIMESHERRLRIFLDRGMRPLVGSSPAGADRGDRPVLQVGVRASGRAVPRRRRACWGSSFPSQFSRWFWFGRFSF